MIVKKSDLETVAVKISQYPPENLKEVALVRIANPDVSLGDLRTLLGNNISRAGIKYRLDKIIQMYKELKGE